MPLLPAYYLLPITYRLLTSCACTYYYCFFFWYCFCHCLRSAIPKLSIEKRQILVAFPVRKRNPKPPKDQVSLHLWMTDCLCQRQGWRDWNLTEKDFCYQKLTFAIIHLIHGKTIPVISSKILIKLDDALTKLRFYSIIDETHLQGVLRDWLEVQQIVVPCG